jgi:hypothetical protein
LISGAAKAQLDTIDIRFQIRQQTFHAWLQRSQSAIAIDDLVERLIVAAR